MSRNRNRVTAAADVKLEVGTASSAPPASESDINVSVDLSKIEADPESETARVAVNDGAPAPDERSAEDVESPPETGAGAAPDHRDDILGTFEEEIGGLMSRIQSFGGKVAMAPEEIAAFARERAAFLEQHADDPSFHKMLKNETRNIGLKAGIVLSDAGDKVDVAAQTATLEATRTALGIAVKLLAKVAAAAAL